MAMRPGLSHFGLALACGFSVCVLGAEGLPKSEALRPKEGERLMATHRLTLKKPDKEYRVFVFESRIHSRWRVEVLEGGRHLDGLHNRFGALARPEGLVVTVFRDAKGRETLQFRQGGIVEIDLTEKGPSTAIMYDALEKMVRQSFKPPADFEINLGRPAGLLKRSYLASVDRVRQGGKRIFHGWGPRYLVTLEGEITSLSLESSVVAYCAEGIKASNDDDRQKIARSLIELDNPGAVLIKSPDDIPGYKKRPLDRDLEGAVRSPWTYTDRRGTLYWITYTYTQLGGRVDRYKFRFYKGIHLSNPVEKVGLGHAIGDVQYPL